MFDGKQSNRSMNTKVPNLNVLITALICSILLLAGCDQARSTSISNATKTSSASEDASDTLEFGPVYSAQSFSDPVVEKTVQGARKKGKVVSAEIRGYLVDWVDSGIVEFVVMKDGNAYRLGGFTRPAAAFGRKAPKRVEPEPQRELRARKRALTRAHEVVSAIYPKFASVDPSVYNYLVRIHYKGGSHDDIWVDPDVGQGRFFYVTDAGFIGPIYRVDNISDQFVARAFKNTETTGSPAVSVQIGGYLVNWRLKPGSDQETLEYVVVKNGSLFKRMDDRARTALSGKATLPENESEAETALRQIALKHAQEYVSKAHPKFRRVEPLVHEYLLEISRKDHARIYAWVRPDGTVRKQQRKLMLDDVQLRF